jgi:hypothetical protein
MIPYSLWNRYFSETREHISRNSMISFDNHVFCRQNTDGFGEARSGLAAGRADSPSRCGAVSKTAFHAYRGDSKVDLMGGVRNRANGVYSGSQLEPSISLLSYTMNSGDSRRRIG